VFSTVGFRAADTPGFSLTGGRGGGIFGASTPAGGGPDYPAVLALSGSRGGAILH